MSERRLLVQLEVSHPSARGSRGGNLKDGVFSYAEHKGNSPDFDRYKSVIEQFRMTLHSKLSWSKRVCLD